MDYFKQRRAYRKLKRDQIDISTGQNNLYRELLDYANDEYQLDTLFTLKNSALLDLTGLSEAGMKKARNELVQLGLIKYVPGKRNQQKPKYQIIKLYSTSWDTTNSKSSSTGTPNSSSTSNPTSSSTGSSKVLTSTSTYNLTNNSNNNQDDPNPFVPLINMYQQEFGIMSPTAKQQVFDSVSDFTKGGATDQQASEIIQYAISIAVSYNKRYWNYTSKILDDWVNHSLFDLDNIKAYQNKPHNPKGSYKNFNHKPKEQATDWDKLKAKEPLDNSSNLQDRLKKLRDEKNVTRQDKNTVI